MNALGASLSKFPHLGEPIREDNFVRWTNNNFYRTSYSDMNSKVSLAFLWIYRHPSPTSEPSFQNMQGMYRG